MIPVKAFAAAKQRLTGALEPQQRIELARAMATRVVRAAHGHRVFVVCDDADVREWADGLEADVQVLWTAERGLNGAVDHGVSAAADAGFDQVVIAHSDLPLATDLGAVARPGVATFVPDAKRDGTNVMSFPTLRPITAQYGAGSFARHWSAAAGTERELRTDALLSIDVDTPHDLSHPLLTPFLREVFPQWQPTSPANPFTR